MGQTAISCTDRKRPGSLPELRLTNLVKNFSRTVVVTIHQPRSNIVALFDQLVLLAKGRAVYSDPFENCQPYFDNIGYTCPPGVIG
jgi:ABC-type multidrug transport system ATPase subunit